MNLKMTTQWLKNERRTYLIVTVSADGSNEASASETYLDIQLPEGVRIRHIGELPSDGHGNSVGVDLPNLSTGDHQNIVFKVRARGETKAEIAPELHLHWIDSSSGDLVERHQAGTPVPTKPTEPNEELVAIVKNAQSISRRNRNAANMENEFMNMPEPNITRRPRRGGPREHTRSNREFSHHGERAGRYAWGAARYGAQHADRYRRADRPHGGKGHLRRTIAEMQERMEILERRIAKLQGRGRIVERETHREIVRTRRAGGSGRGRTPGHHGHRMHGEGRRMGRMMRRAFNDRHDA